MRNHVRDFVRECPCCQKMSAIRIPIQLHHFASSTYNPIDTINMDFIGPFPDDAHVLVIIDTFSRWTELFWCPDSTVVSACRALLRHFGRFGAPNLIRSERGPDYVNKVIKEFLEAVGTGYNQMLAYSKEENSIVERIDKEVNRHLRAFTFETIDIEQYKICLPFVRRIINCSRRQQERLPPTSFQNTAECIGAIIGILCLLKLGVSNEDIELRGDSLSALTWAKRSDPGAGWSPMPLWFSHSYVCLMALR